MADHETKIVVTGDSSGAQGALQRVVGAFKNVHATVNFLGSAFKRLMASFGLFGLAVNGISSLVQSFKSLREWLNRTEEISRRLSMQEALNLSKEATDRLTKSQKYYNEELSKSLDNLERLKNNADLTLSSAYSVEDRRNQYEKAKEMALAETPEERSEVERRWRVKEEGIQRRREWDRMGAAADNELDKANHLDAAAEKAEKHGKDIWLEKEKAEARFRVDWSNEAKEEYYKNQDELLDRYWKNEDEIKKLRAEAAQARERADTLYRARNELQAVGSAAELQYDREVKDEAIKKQEEERDKRIREEQFKKAERLAELRRQYEAAEKARRVEQEIADSRTENLKSDIDEYQSFARSLSGIGPSENRLTALGLGSGVAAKADISGDVKRIIDLIKIEIDEIKANRPNEFTPLVIGE